MEKLVAEKAFRPDLFYRLNVVPLKLPPLRNRPDDILPLTDLFLRIYNQKYGKHKQFTPTTRARMQSYRWPGNVRELRNFIERAVIMFSGNLIKIPQIEIVTDFIAESSTVSVNGSPPDQSKAFDQGMSLSEYMEQCEMEYVKYALDHTRSTYAAAAMLQTSQSAVMRKKKKYQI